MTIKCMILHSIVVRTLVLAGELSPSYTRLSSAIGQPTWPTQPSIPQGSVNE